MPQAPQREEDASSGYEDPSTLSRLDTIDNEIKGLKQNFRFVKDTNTLIIFVLFIALIALIFTVIFFFIQTINSDTQSRNALSDSVRDLNSKIDASKENKTIVNTPSP